MCFEKRREGQQQDRPETEGLGDLHPALVTVKNVRAFPSPHPRILTPKERP